jgi:uncharacterized peroxidase-related enzyme
MSWIKRIEYDEADGKLKKMYNRVKGPNDTVDNVLMLHSLRPHTLAGHMTLYKSVLHHSSNTLPKWYLEALGVYVSHLNNCNYCVDHHFEGFKRLLKNDSKASQFLKEVKENSTHTFFGPPYNSGFAYSKKLTLKVQDIEKEDFENLKTSGFTDGEILEINQVTSYFNYVNRSVLGLGITTEGDILGLSPNDNEDSENWGHS